MEHKNRTVILLGISLAMFLGALDQTIVSPAMPRIVAQLGGLDRYSWVSTIYLLISTLLVPIYGKLSDTINRKHLQIWSIAVFLIGSALCGLAGQLGFFSILGDPMTQLIVFRGIQALGGAGLFALALIIISDLYAPRERARIGGLFGGIFGLASILGPLIGGFLTDNADAWIQGVAGWRWVFYVNLPIGVIALLFIILKMPRFHPQSQARKLNLLSAFLMVAAFFPLILALQLDKNTWGWNSPQVLGLLASALVFLVLWIFHSRKTDNPVLDLGLFRGRIFTTGNLAIFFFGATFMGLIIFLPLYMVNVQGVSATSAGLSVIPLSIGTVLGAGTAGPLATRFGRYKIILLVGSGLALTGSILMFSLGPDAPMWQVVVYMVIVGLGFGPAQSLYSLAVQNGVDVREVGQATSTIQFSRQIGSTVGAALMGALLTAGLSTAFSTNLGSLQSGSSMAAMAGFETKGEGGMFSSRGPEEIRQQIQQGFATMATGLEELYGARGQEARTAWEAFMADAAIPPQVKQGLEQGSPSMVVEADFKRLEDRLYSLVLAGDTRALGEFWQAQAAALMPASLEARLQSLAMVPGPQREAGWLQVLAQVEPVKAMAMDTASTADLTVRKQELVSQGKVLGDMVYEGIRKSFDQAVHQVWFLGIFTALLMVLATIALPDQKLRGRGEGMETLEAAET